MPPSLHAVLGASSSHRWLACPPSARLAEKFDARYGRSESVFAKEGTKAHSLAEAKLRRAIWDADKMTTAIFSRWSPEKQLAYEGINEYRYRSLREELGEIPSDMEHATDSYCDIAIEKYLAAKEADPGAQIFLERKLDYSKWVPSGFGTGDCIIVSDSLLEVLDYKHGKGVPVSAKSNSQMRLYALGAIVIFGSLYDFANIRTTIIQPRLESVSDETISRDELLSWAETEVVERAKQAWVGSGEFCPGEHCRWCSAKAVCSARVAQALKMFQYGMEAPGVISDEQIADILPLLDDAENWIDDIRLYANTQAQRGQVFRGFKLVRGKKPNRRWADPDEVESVMIRAGYPAEAFRETRVKPVGEIEKTLGKTAFKALLGGLVHQGDGPLILVPESDKRIAYSSADAAFDDLTDLSSET